VTTTPATRDSPFHALAQLDAAAVLGVDRLGQAPEVALPPRIKAAASRFDGAARLLAMAAGLAQFTAAGALPTRVDASTMPTPDERADDPAPPGVARVMRRILDEEPLLLPECLALLATARRTVPHEALPPLLEHAASHRTTRTSLSQVLGGRGRWLAALKPEWGFAADAHVHPQPPADAAAQWETASIAQRASLLRAVRAADPGLGRSLIEQTWDADTSADRAQFIAALEIGLSLDDEPLLERALDARQAERSAAASLLARLPGSALSARMAERLAAIITIHTSKAGMLRRSTPPTLEADPPEAPDKPMRRDGVDGRAIHGLGKRASVLCKVAALAPLDTFAGRTGLAPASLVEAARSSDWWDALRAGWLEAACQRDDAIWTRALIDALSPEELDACLSDGRLSRALALLLTSDDDATLRLIRRISASSHGLFGLAQGIGASTPETVSDYLSNTAIKRLRQSRASTNAPIDYYGDRAMEALCINVPAPAAPALLQQMDAMHFDDPRERLRNRCRNILELRTRLHEEMQRA
jgi:hypothetical protein